jgi:hypothetical protein
MDNSQEYYDVYDNNNDGDGVDNVDCDSKNNNMKISVSTMRCYAKNSMHIKYNSDNGQCLTQ